MVRYCVVKNCNESDKSILAHRFPKALESRIKWQKSLGLESYDLEQLYNKFVVCINHFKPSDYRNSISKHLNVTAVPHLSGCYSQIPSALEAQNKCQESTVEIMDMSDIDDCPNIATKAPGKTIEYVTVHSQRRRKRDEKTNMELAHLSKVALQKVTTNPSVQETQILTANENKNEPQIMPETINSKDLVRVSLIEEVKHVSSVDTACQTDLQNDESEFGTLSRADLLRLLQEKDEKIERLEKKISKFESAMAAFKLLMNPLDID